MKKVAFHTLGCKVNQYETESMAEMFEESGYELVDEDSIADVYVINTCTVTNMSASKSRQFIRRAKKKNKNSIIAVVGCYSQVSPEEIEEIKGVDVILGTDSRSKIVDLCNLALYENKKINIVKNAREYNKFEDINLNNVDSMTRAYIKIQDGCNQFCSYCIIPYARGPIRSRSLVSILKEVKRLTNLGFKEIVLTGIHVASYGKDLGDIRLIDVIEEISKIEGVKRIRLSSVEPNIINDDFMIRAVLTNKLCDHFHLSLQSGSDDILRKMNRKYTTQEYKEKVNLIRKYMPEAGITTDIIVGFPTETDENFEETLDFVEKINFSRIHVFKYSIREGTKASKMTGQINGKIKNKRSQELINLSKVTSKRFTNKMLGKNYSVLIEEKIDGYYEGYTNNYIRVKVKSNKDLDGKIINVKIIDNSDNILLGKIL